MPKKHLSSCVLVSLLVIGQCEQVEQACPYQNISKSQQFCLLWRKSIASIPYDLPWTKENAESLKDSIMHHCKDRGLLHSRPCCPSHEWTCREFKRSRSALHEGILHSVEEEASTGGEDKSTSSCISSLHPHAHPHDRLLILIVGVPGSGKTSLLRRFARVIIALHDQGDQDLTLQAVLQQWHRSLQEDLCDGSHVFVSADEMKSLLAARSVWSPTLNQVVVNEDELSKRADDLRREANAADVLVHSQYLHRESIFLADELFLRGVRHNRHIVMEKTMTSFEQVEKYIDIVRNCSAASPAGPCAPSSKFRVVILAAEAELAACLRANDRRRQRGHVLERSQIETQHERFRSTLQQLLGRPLQAGEQRLSNVTLWVFDTSPVLEHLMRGESLLEASRRMLLKTKTVVDV
uniref:Zeta toxin domain-containing protein n=1 Tax=Hanusia phi TaxID=3032 RepID=A0A7S0F3Z8_9CRYP|mmetsp:Transcript_3684/g.9125  ORF Transcript_3684/g.9125 Transcript_3684/m.9125 type:complete len:408 (+) Transcript_3684:92-1315(+)